MEKKSVYPADASLRWGSSFIGLVNTAEQVGMVVYVDRVSESSGTSRGQVGTSLPHVIFQPEQPDTMAKVQEFEVLSDASNAVVARHPSRNHPGVLIQGDSLRALLGDVNELVQEAEGAPYGPMPPGHVSVKATAEQIVEATIGGGKYPK